MLFKRKSKRNGDKVYLAEFNGQHISTGQVKNYLIKLHEEFINTQFGYDYYKKHGQLRFLIYADHPVDECIKMYFEDRCPAMIEEECSNS